MRFAELLVGGAALGIAITCVCWSSEPAAAGYVVTLTQVGSDVVASGSGPIDLAGLTFVGDFAAGLAEILPSAGTIVNGQLDTETASAYIGFTGPTIFGSGGDKAPDTTSGDWVALAADIDIDLPTGYVSGSPLSDSSIYDNQTFASLGVTPGTYVWKWGRGPNENFTLVVPASVPEPPTLLLLVFGAAFASVPFVRAIRNSQRAR